MTQICLTALYIAVIFNVTQIIIKKMELSWMDKKNEKEGKYVN